MEGAGAAAGGAKLEGIRGLGAQEASTLHLHPLWSLAA